MRPEPPGQNCYLGGVTIVVGTDLDDDGVLGAAEITGTSYLCNVSSGATLEGSYQIANTLDLALLAGVHTITGTLGTFGQMPEVELPDLEAVGAIFINSLVIGVPALRTIGGNAGFSQCHQLTAPVLESVGGWLSAYTAGTLLPLDSLDLPALRTIGGDLFTSSQLVHVRLPALVSAGNIQQFWTEVTDLDLSSLQHVGSLTLD